MKKKRTIAVLISVIITTAVLALCGLLLLPVEIEKSEFPTGENVSGINYYSDVTSCGILCRYEDGSGALLFLNFDTGSIYVSLYEDSTNEKAAKEGYDISYSIDLTADFLCRFCDRLGGITMSEAGSERRFSSVGLRNKLKEMTAFDDRIAIFSAFFERISKIGLSLDDIKFIIKETENDLVYPVCYHWVEPFKEMAGNCIFK